MIAATPTTERKYEADPVVWRTRNRLWRANPRCRYCGRRVSKKRATIDHVRAKIRGGENEARNFTLSCPNCNVMKGSLSAAGFAAWHLVAAARALLIAAGVGRGG